MNTFFISAKRTTIFVFFIMSFAIESQSGTITNVNPKWVKVTFGLNKDLVEKCIEQLEIDTTLETYTGRKPTDPGNGVFSACILKINNFKSSFVLGQPIKFAFNMKSKPSVRIDGHITADSLALQVYAGYSNGGDSGAGASRQAHESHLREAYDQMPKQTFDALVAVIQ